MLHCLTAWLLFPVVTDSTTNPLWDRGDHSQLFLSSEFASSYRDASQSDWEKNLTEIIQTMTIQCYSLSWDSEDYLIMNVSRKYFEKFNKNVGYFIMLKLVLQQSIRVSYGSQIFPKYFYERQKTYWGFLSFCHLIVFWQQKFLWKFCWF